MIKGIEFFATRAQSGLGFPNLLSATSFLTYILREVAIYV